MNARWKIALYRGLLREIPDLVRGELRASLNAAAKRGNEPEQRFHQRRFARPVFSDDAEIVALVHGKAELMQHSGCVVADRQAV